MTLCIETLSRRISWQHLSTRIISTLAIAKSLIKRIIPATQRLILVFTAVKDAGEKSSQNKTNYSPRKIITSTVTSKDLYAGDWLFTRIITPNRIGL